MWTITDYISQSPANMNIPAPKIRPLPMGLIHGMTILFKRVTIFWLHTANLQRPSPHIKQHWWYLQENDNKRIRDRKVNVDFVEIGFTGRTDFGGFSHPAIFSCLVRHNRSRFQVHSSMSKKRAMSLRRFCYTCYNSFPPQNHYLAWIICLSQLPLFKFPT
jgi:hypothetical protein